MKKEYVGVMTFAQQAEGAVSPVSLELIGKARELGGPVTAVVAPHNTTAPRDAVPRDKATRAPSPVASSSPKANRSSPRAHTRHNTKPTIKKGRIWPIAS